MRELPNSDLQEIVTKSEGLHDNFRDANILILGPNGFIGNWLRQGFQHLNQTLGLNINIIGIVRNSSQTKVKTEGIYREQTFQSWRNYSDDEIVTHVFHCATNSRDIENHGQEGANEIIDLTANAIQKVSRNAVPKFIHLSSGAVYGESARTKRLIGILTPTESYANLDSYGRIKIRIENLVRQATEKGQILGGNPRLFTFYGPGLSLDMQFAISSFVKSANAGNNIEIVGNPATERTYMYPTDLISELFKCADSPSIKPIHLGGAKILTMSEIANEVANVWNVKVDFPKATFGVANFYIPEVSKIRNSVSLFDGLLRWKSWLTANK
jgi:nucleoside-diphosphate-sugar epimerase